MTPCFEISSCLVFPLLFLLLPLANGSVSSADSFSSLCLPHVSVPLSSMPGLRLHALHIYPGEYHP